MKSVRLFVASPIAGFDNNAAYIEYRNKVIHLIRQIQEYSQIVELYSALTSVSSQNEYDSPEEAAIQDLSALNKATHFILFYPQKVATSALIELGFALAQNKRILLIVNRVSDLPYMAQGFTAPPFSVSILQKTIDEISVSDFRQFLSTGDSH